MSEGSINFCQKSLLKLIKTAMDSLAVAAAEKQAHVVCIPALSQSHIKVMLRMAKILHSKGIIITFVNTEFNHKRFLKSGGLQSLQSLGGFRFETIPDGLPPSDADKTQDIPEIIKSIFEKKMLPPFQNLLTELNAGRHQVTSILSDGFMSFTADAAHSLGIPIVLLWTISACGFMGYYQFKNVRDRGLVPLKDESYLTNGYLDTKIDWIPGIRDIHLADLPSHVRIIDPNDTLFDYFVECFQSAATCTAHVLHTFDDLEQELVNAISSMFNGTVYTIGPQQFLIDQMPINQKEGRYSTGYSLWEEEKTCLQWLDSKEPDSVVYVNFGSIAVMSAEQLMEFGWGLANSNCCFLWIIRPDLIVGESTVNLGNEFLDAVKNRGLISSWCPQEDVLNHASVGGFLTHGGWSSILESISAGVPMLCWPFFGDQTINCKFLSDEWECGMKIPKSVKRGDVEKFVRLLMDGIEGKKLRNKAMEWKKMAVKACAPDGSSSLNLDKLVLLLKN